MRNGTARAAAIVAVAAAAPANAKAHIDNTKLLAESGLRIVHVRRAFGEDSDVTVAYRETGKGGRVLEIATAITNPHDCFTKKLGTKLAIEHFQSGRTILIPNQDGASPAYLFRAMFGGQS